MSALTGLEFAVILNSSLLMRGDDRGYGGPALRDDARPGPIVCASPFSPVTGEPGRPGPGQPTAVMTAAPSLVMVPSIPRHPGVGIVTGSARSATQIETPSTPASSGRTGIRIEALYRLRRAGYLALWDVSCDLHGNCLRIHGRLPSYYLKQVAQAVVAGVEGVDGVVNLIKVGTPAARPEPDSVSGHPSRSEDGVVMPLTPHL